MTNNATDELHSTQNDVALDVVAALDMYDGSMGAEGLTIDKVGEGPNDSVIVILSNGDEYELRVRCLREGAAVTNDRQNVHTPDELAWQHERLAARREGSA